MTRFLALLLLTLPAVAARADEVLLAGGGTLEGKATREGDQVVVTTPHGSMRMAASEVKEIRVGRTVWDDYADKAKATSGEDASAQSTLGAWCREKGLSKEARKHFERAIAIDPDEAAARKALGFVRYEDRWLTLDEYRRARGLVKVGDEWIPSEEARRRDVGKRDRQALKQREKTIRDAVLKMSSMKRKTRAEGELALEAYAESIGDLKLAEFATKVEAYYDAEWRRVKQALVTAEIRTTWSQLKRPIPTFTTSLGGFSTPVTIQLPEMSVVSVQTTALIPAEIELDDE